MSLSGDGLSAAAQDQSRSFERLRAVGRLEKYSTIRHDLKFYLNAAVTAMYELSGLPPCNALPDGKRSFQSIIEPYIHSAIRELVPRHPILSAVIVDEPTETPYFARLPSLKLKECITFVEPEVNGSMSQESIFHEQLELVLTEQHNKGFMTTCPYWRLVVLPGSPDTTEPLTFTTIFVFHHALLDGGSAVNFHHELRRALSRVLRSRQSPRDGDVVDTGNTQPLLPPVDELLPMPVSLSYLSAVLFREKIYNPRPSGLWTGPIVSGDADRTKCRLDVFSSKDTDIFRGKCRENNTTVAATLQVVVANALFFSLPEECSMLKCIGDISWRPWLPSEVQSVSGMGVYFQSFEEHYHRKLFAPVQDIDRLESASKHSYFPWSEARRSRATINRIMAKKGADATTSLLRFVRNYKQELFLSKIGKPRAISFIMSSLGVVDGGSGDDLTRLDGSRECDIGDIESGMEKREREQTVRLRRVVASQSAGVTGPPISIMAITGGDGCLSLSYTWFERILEPILVDRLRAEVRTLIKDLVCT